jgi:hypothetical protein
MEAFSLAKLGINDLAEQAEEARAMRPADAWTASDRTPEQRQERLDRSQIDFWFFDRTYWPPELYEQGYSDPCEMHSRLLTIAETPGVQVVLGSRSSGKTVTCKKLFVWKILTGRVQIGGTYSHTLPTASNILTDIVDLIRDNPRIMEDYGVKILKANEEQFALRVKGLRSTVRVGAYSEGRSVRGYSRGFLRPSFFLADDCETRQSPRSPAFTRERIRVWSEAYKSMTPDGTFLMLGNDFAEETAMHRLRVEQDQGLLAERWKVWVFPAWIVTPLGGRSLWPARWPATSEAELRALLAPSDDGEWNGDYMQDPRPIDGEIFKRFYFSEYLELPDDARGVIFCDPNLSKKGKGDQTGIIALLYSRSTARFYVYRYRLKSYSGSNNLLNDVMEMRDERIFAIGFDGHVNQESTWTNNVRNWCAEHDAPFPRIDYKRYSVDLLAKNVTGDWDEGKILFPVGMALTSEGKAFIEQVFTFEGKAANLPDDAPDCLISAYELIHERKFARRERRGSSLEHTVSVTDIYSF